MTDSKNDSDIQEPTTSASNKRKAEWFDIDDERNTHVYVSGLPKTITEEEFIDLMKKYGIIAKNLTLPGCPYKVKLYKDDDGSFKGDARCCYARVESVELAITNLDGYIYDEKHTLLCERAKFELKGSYDPTKRVKLPGSDKNLKIRQRKKLDRLLSWDPQLEVQPKRVVLKYMFTPEEMIEDASLIVDIKEDIETKCEEIGCPPKRIDIHDRHPDGVVEITFAQPDHATRCVNTLDNQFYAGRTVKAELWDGKTKYKIKETDEEAKKRIEKWHQDIV